MPRLSIITINRNNAAGLEATLDSVWNRQQSFADFEHIVIDGASTDGSTGVIDRYADRLAYHVSEPDSGIYNAMNKGIGHATGDYLLFLNSGDRLIDNILCKIFNTSTTEDILYADVILVSDGNQEVYTYPDQLTLPYMLTYSLCHQSTFISRNLFDDGLYDESLRISSDWTFIVDRVIIKNVSYKHIPLPTTYFDLTGISADTRMRHITEAERSAYIRAHFPQAVLDLVDDYNRREQVLDIMSKHRIDELLSSRWVQRKARQCIKALMRIDRILHKPSEKI